MKTLNQSKEANWVFPAVQKGKCPGCKKSGHDTDATYCKYCGSRFPQYWELRISEFNLNLIRMWLNQVFLTAT